MSARLAESLAELRLKGGSSAPVLRAAVRAATRAADEAEVAALEGHDLSERRAALAVLSAAREEIAGVRADLRSRIAAEREQVVARDQSVDTSTGGAAQAARDINDGLRRATAVLSGELERSRAAGNVVDSSGRTLVATLERQRDYGGTLKDGTDVLRDLKRAERRANGVLALSVVIFVVVAIHITRKRISNSNTAYFIVRPALWSASIPVRISRKLIRAVRAAAGSKNVSRSNAARNVEVGRPLAPDKARRLDMRSGAENVANEAHIGSGAGGNRRRRVVKTETAATRGPTNKRDRVVDQRAVGDLMGKDGGTAMCTLERKLEFEEKAVAAVETGTGETQTKGSLCAAVEEVAKDAADKVE